MVILILCVPAVYAPDCENAENFRSTQEYKLDRISEFQEFRRPSVTWAVRL